MTTPDTIRIFVPLEYRAVGGRTQILSPENRLDAEDRQQDPHIQRALARVGLAAEAGDRRSDHDQRSRGRRRAG